MPQEGDQRRVGDVYEGYLDARWIPLESMTQDQLTRWLLAAQAQKWEVSPEDLAALTETHAGALAAEEAQATPGGAPSAAGPGEEAEGFLPPVKWPKGQPWPLTKMEPDENEQLQVVPDLDAIDKAYKRFGDPYAEPEKPKEPPFKGFATQAEAARNAPPGHAPQYNPQTNTWLNEPVEEQPRPVFVETGGAARPSSMEQLIVGALVEGDFAKATRYDDFRRRPSIADAIQIASQYAKNAEEFQELLGLMQAFGGFGPETPFEPSFAKAPGVTPGQAAEAVGRFAAGEVGAKPPTPWTPPGFPRVPQPSDVDLLPELTAEQIISMGEDPTNYFGENARRLKERYYALNPPPPPPDRLQPLPPEWEEALRHTKETVPENYPAALKWAQQYQEALAEAKALGGKGAVGVGPVQGGQLGTGFALDLSNLTPQQLQSQFGPLAQPSMEALEGLSWEEQKQLTGLGDEALTAEWQSFGEWRKRQPKKPTAQQFERFLSLTKPQKPPAVPVTRRF